MQPPSVLSQRPVLWPWWGHPFHDPLDWLPFCHWCFLRFCSLSHCYDLFNDLLTLLLSKPHKLLFCWLLCSCTVMEQVAGTDFRKGSFLTKRLIGKKRVLKENKWKLVVFQNISSLLISKSKPFLIYLHSLVWTWTHLVHLWWWYGMVW
jgi:hypothetical protein